MVATALQISVTGSDDLHEIAHDHGQHGEDGGRGHGHGDPVVPDLRSENHAGHGTERSASSLIGDLLRDGCVP